MPKWNYYKTNSLLVCAQERNKTLETLSCPGHYPFPPSLKNHYPESSHFLAFLYSCLHPLDTIVQSCLLKKKSYVEQEGTLSKLFQNQLRNDNEMQRK